MKGTVEEGGLPRFLGSAVLPDPLNKLTFATRGQHCGFVLENATWHTSRLLAGPLKPYPLTQGASPCSSGPPSCRPSQPLPDPFSHSCVAVARPGSICRNGVSGSPWMLVVTMAMSRRQRGCHTKYKKVAQLQQKQCRERSRG